MFYFRLIFLLWNSVLAYKCINIDLIKINSIPIFKIDKYITPTNLQQIKINSIIGNDNIISTQICLETGHYVASVNPSLYESGIIICSKQFINAGQRANFYIKNNGCYPEAVKDEQFSMPGSPQSGFYQSSSLQSGHYQSSSPQSGSYQSLKISHQLFSYSFSAQKSYITRIPSPEPTSREPTTHPTSQEPTSQLTSREPTSQKPTSREPSTHPTTHPSTQLSTQPSTRVPTYHNSIVPTPVPSIESEPTIQTLPIARFSASIILSVSSNISYDSTSQLAICTATTMTLNILPKSCIYYGTTFIQTSRRRLSTYNAASSLTISVQSANPLAYFTAATNSLASAASSGLFTANLMSSCAALGLANAVSSATVTGASTSGLTIIQPPTMAPTALTNRPIVNRPDLVPTNIVIIVVVIGLGFGFGFVCWKHFTSKKTAIHEPTIEETSILLIIDEIPESSPSFQSESFPNESFPSE